MFKPLFQPSFLSFGVVVNKNLAAGKSDENGCGLLTTPFHQ